jgi:uncharacterized DUF497 family protein
MMDLLFAWDDRNVEHIARHGISPREAEHVVRHAQKPWPEQKGDDKLLVWGANQRGKLLQVIFTLKHPDELEFESLTAEQWAELDDDDEVIYVIHAMPLTESMKRKYRRRRK